MTISCVAQGKVPVTGAGQGTVTAAIDGSGGGSSLTRTVSTGTHTLAVRDTGGRPRLSWTDSTGNCA